MRILNFSFLAPIWRGVMRGKNSEKEKKEQKTTFLGLLRDEMGLKSRDPQKAYLGLLLNIYNKFQLPSSIWRGIMRGTNSMNSKNEKTTSLELRGVEMGLKSRHPQMAYIGHLLTVHT